MNFEIIRVLNAAPRASVNKAIFSRNGCRQYLSLYIWLIEVCCIEILIELLMYSETLHKEFYQYFYTADLNKPDPKSAKFL